MNKRTFLKNMALIGMGAAAANFLWACGKAKKELGFPVWTWISGGREASYEGWQTRLKLLQDRGVTGVFIGKDDPMALGAAKDLGMDAHLWWWTLNRGDKEIMEQHPEWYAVNRLGESCHDKPPYVDYYRWLCPSRPEVHEYLLNDVEQLAARDYIDGIQMDYVRYCDVILPKALWKKYNVVQDSELPQFDFCYCEVCRSTFKEQTGVDPLQDDDPPANEAWVQYRYDTVTAVVNKISARVRAAGKQVSAAVFPTPSIAKQLVRQDWVNWDLDMIFPMVYQGFYEEDILWIGQAVKEGVEALSGKFPLYSGLYMPNLPNAMDLSNAAKLSMNSGASGISIFGDPGPVQWDGLVKSD